ncbi:hypothetical protein [Methylobacterium sp. A54F]
MTLDDAQDDFSRLHRIFIFHLGVAVALSWTTAAYAACYAPWVRNIRALLEAGGAGQVESTLSFLFAMPVVLTIGWVTAMFGREILRRSQTLKNAAVEFAAAAAVAFGIFYIGIDRAVAALYITL